MSTLIISVLSAICYRLGGSAKKGDWLDCLRQRWVRGAICPLLAIILHLCLIGVNLGFWWVYILFFGLSWAAISTYWDWLCGFDNHWLHGFFCGLAALPFIWCGVPWWTVAIRAIVCAILMGVWSKIWTIDTIEEWGRGFIFTATIPLLLVG